MADCIDHSTDSTKRYILESEHLAQINMVNTGMDSIFTQHTDPFKTERVAQILSEVTLGNDLMDEQQEITKAVVKKFADCFALAMSEVNPIPGVSHQLKILADARFQTKISQWSMTPPQRKYLHEKVDEMLAAGIITPIHPRDIRNVAPTVLAQKVHKGSGLTMDELKHRVNDKCISYSIHGEFDLPPRPKPREPATKTPTSQKW